MKQVKQVKQVEQKICYQSKPEKRVKRKQNKFFRQRGDLTTIISNKIDKIEHSNNMKMFDIQKPSCYLRKTVYDRTELNIQTPVDMNGKVIRRYNKNNIMEQLCNDIPVGMHYDQQSVYENLMNAVDVKNLDLGLSSGGLSIQNIISDVKIIDNQLNTFKTINNIRDLLFKTCAWFMVNHVKSIPNAYLPGVPADQFTRLMQYSRSITTSSVVMINSLNDLLAMIVKKWIYPYTTTVIIKHFDKINENPKILNEIIAAASVIFPNATIVSIEQKFTKDANVICNQFKWLKYLYFVTNPKGGVTVIETANVVMEVIENSNI